MSLELCSAEVSPSLSAWRDLHTCQTTTTRFPSSTIVQRARIATSAVAKAATSGSSRVLVALTRAVLALRTLDRLQLTALVIAALIALGFLVIQSLVALRRRVPWWIWRTQALKALEKEFDTLCDARQAVVYSYYWSLDREDATDILKHYYSEIKAYDSSLDMLRKNYTFLQSARYTRGSAVPRMIRHNASLLADIAEDSNWWNLAAWKEQFSGDIAASGNVGRRNFRLNSSEVSMAFLLEYAQRQDLAVAAEIGYLEPTHQSPGGDSSNSKPSAWSSAVTARPATDRTFGSQFLSSSSCSSDSVNNSISDEEDT